MLVQQENSLKALTRICQFSRDFFHRRWPGVRQTYRYLIAQWLGHHSKYLKPTPFTLLQSQD